MPRRRARPTPSICASCAKSACPIRYDEVTQAHRDRLDYELAVIEKMGYASYFLIVWDFVRFAAREQDSLPGPRLGLRIARRLSARAEQRLPAANTTCCSSGFSIRAAPSRPISTSISAATAGSASSTTRRRNTASSNVAQIGTFGTLKAKAAIRDVSRALSIPLARVNEIAKMVPETLNIRLQDALEESPDSKQAYESDARRSAR